MKTLNKDTEQQKKPDVSESNAERVVSEKTESNANSKPQVAIVGAAPRRVRSIQKALALASISAVICGGFSASPSPLPARKPKEIKKCLFCSKSHTHHNSFCSPECCKEYRMNR